jgi:hypothetical protein
MHNEQNKFVENMKDVWEDLIEAVCLKIGYQIVPKQVVYAFSWIELADDWGLCKFCFYSAKPLGYIIPRIHK